jgi:adenine deaminase
MKATLTVWVCLTTFLWAGSKPKTSAQVLVFTNVNVVSMRDGTIARDMTVVIRKGQIRAVAKVGMVGQGHDIQIVNTNGKYMIPGLWDMHVHSAFVSPAWDEKVIYPL